MSAYNVITDHGVIGPVYAETKEEAIRKVYKAANGRIAIDKAVSA